MGFGELPVIDLRLRMINEIEMHPDPMLPPDLSESVRRGLARSYGRTRERPGKLTELESTKLQRVAPVRSLSHRLRKPQRFALHCSYQNPQELPTTAEVVQASCSLTFGVKTEYYRILLTTDFLEIPKSAM